MQSIKFSKVVKMSPAIKYGIKKQRYLRLFENKYRNSATAVPTPKA